MLRPGRVSRWVAGPASCCAVPLPGFLTPTWSASTGPRRWVRQAEASLLVDVDACFVQGAAEALPFGDASFDRRFVDVLPSLGRGAGRTARVSRVLVPGG
jgi:hypothetical protein